MHSVPRLFLALAALIPAALPAAAVAQTYPAKTIRLILPFPPGGSTDILGRTISQKLSEQIGQTVFPDNRPGAGGNLGPELAAKAPPDGYTVILVGSPIAISPSLYAKLNYDVIRDFAPVSLVGAIQNMIVVHNSVPARTLNELIQLARRHPGKLNFSSSGAGSSNHLASELLKHKYKLDMVHVPYKGGAAQLVALMSGQVDMGTIPVPAAIPLVQANKVRALAVLAEQRTAALPNVPTSKEVGVDLEAPVWYGILAPAGTPRPMIDRLNAELRKAHASPNLKERLAASGIETLTSTPEQFASHIKSEIVRYAKIIKDAGIKIE